MKKLTALLCALMLMASCLSALAESIIYELPELDMTLTLPDTVVALTAETDKSVYTMLGMDKDAMTAAMAAQSTYMVIYPFDWNMEINVVMTENVLESLDDIDDASMELMVRVIKQALENEGVTVTDYDVYQIGNEKYFRHFYTADAGNGNANYAMQYYTIRNHKGIVLRMFSYEGMPLTEEQQALMQQIVDGAAYN